MKLLIAGIIFVLMICNNEVVSLIFLLCVGIWGVLKLLDEMDKGGYK